VWFSKQQPETLPELGDLLAADAGSLLGGAPAEGTKQAAAPAASLGVAPKPGNDDDWLKQQTPLV
jgi:hypothetical protein